MVCEECGHELTVGSWPYCPHGAPGKFGVVPDEVPGGFWAENGFAERRKFYSHSEHERALAREGCEIRAKWAGPQDRIMTNWAAATDAQTLANAAVLVGRGAEARAARHQRWPRATEAVTVTPAGTFTGKDLR